MRLHTAQIRFNKTISYRNSVVIADLMLRQNRYRETYRFVGFDKLVQFGFGAWTSSFSASQ